MGEPVDETSADDLADTGVAADVDAGQADSEVPAVPAVQDGSSAAPSAVNGVDPQRMLDALDARRLSEHAEVYEELHAHLQRTLAEIDGG